MLDKRLPFKLEEQTWNTETIDFHLPNKFSGYRKRSRIIIDFYPKDVMTHKRKKDANR